MHNSTSTAFLDYDMVSIAVLQHKRQRVDNMLIIHYLAPLWRTKGYRVTFYNGLDRPLEGDILIPQIDLTITPHSYVEAIEQFQGLVINPGIHDISKSKVSANLVDASSDYEGEVFVKPNLNSNGYPELRLKSKWGKGIHLLKKSLGLVRKGYVVYPSVQDVPDYFKNSEDFVIEKFLPHREGEEYVTGLITFLGDSHRAIELRSKDAIIKSHTNYTRREVEAPSVVLEAIDRLKFDFGKFDYCFHDGELVLFDTNKTPGAAADKRISNLVAEKIGPGIEYYIKQL
ncbi:MAG: hypothetical protein RIC80_04410 [Cyclobacteriaceae bacterium]